MATRGQIHADGSEHNPRLEVLMLCYRQSYAKYSDLYWHDLTRGEWNYWTVKLCREGLLKAKWMGKGCFAWRGYALSDKELKKMRVAKK